MTSQNTVIVISREIVPDEHHDASYLEQEGFEERLAAYRRGAFGFVGVRAVAEIRRPHGAGWIISKMRSPGLWSIEADSSESYFNEVYAEEVETLEDMLSSLRSFDVEVT